MRAPCFAKLNAVARPMPVRAPVIKTTGVSMVNSLERNLLSVDESSGSRHVCEFELQPVRVGEIDREISWRVRIFRRRIEDSRANFVQEAEHLIDVGPVLGAERQMVKSWSASIV